VSRELGSVFDVAAKVMDYTSARARALNTNLAHQNQPGYRRVDVDFTKLLDAVRAEGTDRERRLESVRPEIRTDQDAPVGENGNSVRFEQEQMEIEKNALLHEITAQMLNGRLNQLRSAISGRSA